MTRLVAGLPDNLDAAVFIVLHLPPTTASALPSILQRHTGLPVASAVDEEPIHPGYVWVAPPDHHLILRNGHMSLNRGPKENRHRPAIDPLFRSAARVYGPRVIGVILSGTLDDGAAGLLTIKSRGGMAVVQEPSDAAFAGMPLSAMESVEPDLRLPASEIGPAIAALTREPVREAVGVGSRSTMDNELSRTTDPIPLPRMDESRPPGPASGYTCPECHGALWEVDEDDLTRYRCRVGHAFSVDSLIAGQSESLEMALWTALRALEERTELARRVMERALAHGQTGTAERFREQVQDGERNAGLLRQALLSGETYSDR